MAPASNGLSFKRLLAAEMERAAGRKPANSSSVVKAVAGQTSSNRTAAFSTSGALVRTATGSDLTDLRVLADIAIQRSSFGAAVKVRELTSADHHYYIQKKKINKKISIAFIHCFTY